MRYGAKCPLSLSTTGFLLTTPKCSHLRQNALWCVKAGERIRTADVQLGKWQARQRKARFVKWLQRSPRAGAQLGAGRLASGVYLCHLLAEYGLCTT